MKFAVETWRTGEDLFKCLQVSVGNGGDENDLVFTSERWVRLAALAAKAGLSPYLFRSLPIADSSLGIPSEVKTRWMRDYLASAAWNGKLRVHLEQVVAALSRRGVSVILLKGVHVMETLYADRAMRTAGDIDLLVQPADKGAVLECMSELGYVSINSPALSDPVHSAFVHSSSNVAVEVHFRIQTDASRNLDLRGFWLHSEPMGVNGQDARVLAPDDLLIHLCLHLTDHVLQVMLFPALLRSLLDIALLLRKHSEEIDWGRMLRTVEEMHCERHFAISIVLAERVLLVPLAPALQHFVGAMAIASSDIEMLTKHLLISCERDMVEALMPKFIRSSAMARESNLASGFLGRVFLSRAELAHRYGPCTDWRAVCRRYLSHFQSLVKGDAMRGKWALGKDTLALTTHFRSIARLRDRLNP